jgi:hypothetical protein
VQVRLALVGLLVVLAAVTLGAAPTPASDATPSASTCIECCEGDAVCESLAGLADLRETVGELIEQQGTANSLDAKLSAATDSVLKLNTTPALDQLDAFGHEVDALEQSARISATVSSILKNKHDTVKNSINNIR